MRMENKSWVSCEQADPRWAIADPICTFVFAGLVLLTTRAILRDISDILMERVPRSQDAATIQAGLQAVRKASPPLAEQRIFSGRMSE